MRRTVCAAIAIAAVLPAGEAPAQTRAGRCVSVEVSSGGVPALPSPRSTAPPKVLTNAPSFSATRVLDLTFTVLFPASLAGEHVVELRVFTPDGQLYRSLAVPFAPEAQAGAARAVTGYARPVPQQPLRQVSRGGRGRFAATSTAFPVGGTDIVSSGLYGRWRVEAYLDGADERCAPAAAFVLNP